MGLSAVYNWFWINSERRNNQQLGKWLAMDVALSDCHCCGSSTLYHAAMHQGAWMVECFHRASAAYCLTDLFLFLLRNRYYQWSGRVTYAGRWVGDRIKEQEVWWSCSFWFLLKWMSNSYAFRRYTSSMTIITERIIIHRWTGICMKISHWAALMMHANAQTA